jgi:hypothetical protein
MWIVHVRQGFEFLGYKSSAANNSAELYAITRQKSARRFMDQMSALTRRPVLLKELIDELNPVDRALTRLD